MMNDDSGHSTCNEYFLIERFALAQVNFAAPIKQATNDDNDSSWWISIQQQCRWKYIACNEGSVETLAVHSKDLIGGTISPSVALLSGMRRMDYGKTTSTE